MPAYFNENGVSLPRDANPAEWMIDVVSGDLARDRDWSEVWLASKQYTEVTEELERLKKVNEHIKTTNADDAFQFAAREGTQMRLVLHRANTQIYRQVDYVMNKIALHVGIGLLNGLSWFRIGSNPAGLQNRLFTSFAFLFVARECARPSYAMFELTHSLISWRDSTDAAQVHCKPRCE